MSRDRPPGRARPRGVANRRVPGARLGRRLSARRSKPCVRARVGPGAPLTEPSSVDPGSLAVDLGLVIVAYVVGSIPFGVIVARISGGPDPRAVGSGRAG